MNKNALRALTLSFVVAVLSATLFLSNVFRNLEFRSIDYRFKARGPRSAPTDVAIITADEKSFKALGLWPWARELHGRLIDRLTRAGAKAIAFDILFLEPDKVRPASDRALGAAAARSGRVVFGMLFKEIQDGRPAEPAYPIDAVR